MTADSINAPPTTRRRVLAVDDDRVLRAVITRVLRDAGIDVVAVEVDDALRLLEDNEFDLVICDRSMPGVSGEEFLDVVRSDHRYDFTPFLFLTVSDQIDDIVHGFDAGADDYITKPFDHAELVARVANRLDRAEQARRRQHELVDVETFAFEVERELTRARRGGASGVLAVVNIPSLKAVEATLGDRERRRVLETIAAAMGESAETLDIVGASRVGDLAILMPDVAVRDAANRLRVMATRAASMVTQARGRAIRPVPMIGFTEFESNRVESSEKVFAQAAAAAAAAESTQDLQPRRWLPPDPSGKTEKTDHHPSRDMLQVLSTFAMGVVLPFLIYLILDTLGLDVSWPVYLSVVVALVSTAALIWLEGLFAGRHEGAPPVAGAPEPPASAIICAYMPNEAATIVETIEHFLTVDYQAGLQVILAYNTPHYLPVEAELQSIADRHPNLLLLKVADSNSKAQNLNAALARATGDFIGVFDADHHPDPDSFHRAWRWLSNGYDVVQGHCLVRNPDETFLSRMVAIEFETIYAVAHPGRWMRDGFGIFGGSNGYWRTEALHMTRMRGSMLTEDIDASMRVLEAGGRIASDPDLISRELATTTIRQIWNQRLRWAQGWTQVSLRHVWQMLRLPHFNARQRFGVFALLFQREIYPWISFQIFPLLLFWWVRGDVIDWVVPIFVATSIFATSVGPGRVLIAYRLCHPSLKRKWWFLQYGVFSILLYTEAKNIIARVGHLKEMMGESSWRVTPRSADPADARLPSLVAGAVFEPPAVATDEPADSAEPAEVAAVATPPADEMPAYSVDTTGSCLWCGETRWAAVNACPRCGHGWIDMTLEEAALGIDVAEPTPEPDGPADSARRRRGAMFALAAAAAATVALITLSPPVESAQVTTTRGAEQVVAATVAVTAPSTSSTLPSPLPPTSVAVPATAPPPSTTTSTTSTTTSTTTMPPLPATDPLAADSMELGAFALGPLRFGSSGEYAAGRLVATYGQPQARLEADESWGMCSAGAGRVLQWGGLSAIFRDDGDRERFVGYRYEGPPVAGAGPLRTISGLETGMSLEVARRLYPASILTTGTLEDGNEIFLLLRSSDRRTLLWGPLQEGAEGPTIAGVHSYRPCDRGPFAG